jgi:hypothetical protein
MRNRHFLIALAGLTGTTAVLASACEDYVAEFYTPLTNPALGTGGRDGGTDGGGGSGGTGGTGGTGGSKPDCSGDPSSTNVIDACGVFARADAAAGGTGTMAMPFAKLADAVAAAESAGKRVYACTSAPFVEAVTIGAGIEVYGGFDCAKGWAWSQSGRAVLDGPADAVALTIEKSAGGAKVEGFAITGASPSDMTMGGSSIAVAVDDVAATLDHCNVTASDAADGVAGQTSTNPVMPGASAAAPDPGTMNACVLPIVIAGGAPGVTMCGGVDTSGGAGGKGGVTGTNSGYGADGTDGQIAGNTDHGTGANGANDCADATKGQAGTAGNAGPGGSAMGDTLSVSGIANSDKTDGQPGTPGQGGGGGGGAKSGTFCGSSASPMDGPGASGGGGGAGGCGGLGGGGGKAGGSSIAIVSLGKQLVLASVTLAVGKGGKGGSGTAGQSGGAFGNGANGGAASGNSPSKAGCQGGNGGAGGDGGPGGGARGGHALGIGYAVTPTPLPKPEMFTPGTPGDGGTAGSGAPSTSNGASGDQGQCWDFSTGMACQ